MKKFFLSAISGLLLFTACNSNTESTASTEKKDTAMAMMHEKETKEERNKKIIMASMEAFNAHDADAVLKDVDPAGVDYGDGSMPPIKGVDSVKAGMKSWMAAMPDVKGEDLKYIADGDWVAVWGEWSGTWKGEFMGMKATGKSFKVNDVDIFKLSEDGKILEHHSVQSPMTTAVQIGMKMK